MTKAIGLLLRILIVVGILAGIPMDAYSAGDWLVSDAGAQPWEEINESCVSRSTLLFGDFVNDAGKPVGDGKTDVFSARDGKWYVSAGGRKPWKEINTSQVSINNLRLGDFNGDGTTDVFNARDGKWYVSFSGITAWTEINKSKIPISQLGFGDFVDRSGGPGGDGITDVFTAGDGKWLVSAAGRERWQRINGSNIRVDQLGFGDFNNDGTTDIFNARGGAWFVSWGGRQKWKRINGSKLRINQLGFGDFNGDGTTDVFNARGAWFVSWGGMKKWKRINGSTIRINQLGFGDFNGDRKTDVFWADTRGCGTKIPVDTGVKTSEGTAQASLELTNDLGNGKIHYSVSIRFSGRGPNSGAGLRSIDTRLETVTGVTDEFGVYSVMRAFSNLRVGEWTFTVEAVDWDASCTKTLTRGTNPTIKFTYGQESCEN